MADRELFELRGKKCLQKLWILTRDRSKSPNMLFLYRDAEWGLCPTSEKPGSKIRPLKYQEQRAIPTDTKLGKRAWNKQIPQWPSSCFWDKCSFSQIKTSRNQRKKKKRMKTSNPSSPMILSAKVCLHRMFSKIPQGVPVSREEDIALFLKY